MIKSLFAISSLVSMAGLAVVCVGAGCSDNAPQTTAAATEPEDGGKKPPRTPTPPEAPDDGNQDGASTEPITTCMDTKPFDATTVPYKSPAVKAGSCTTADIKVFDDYIRDNPQATFEDVQATMTKQSKRCSQCVFGSSADEKWAPVVLDGTNVTFNGGGCVSVVSGKDACGKAYQQWNTCLNHVCAACTDQTENSKCKNDAQGASAPCGAASTTLFQACGSNVNSYLKKCFGSGLGTVLEQLCGPPAKDGGT
jgi:hypothetical protein